MRLIADENISWRLKKLIPDWDILPVNEITPFERLSDSMIWRFAKSNNYTIVTFDEDFSELQNLFSFPPKIVWLRTGNVATHEIARILKKHESKITDFVADKETGILELYL
ncbi:DUF5615 family PIN-like protein [Mucilaginibacter calamicampi]|uniref:DUF5615 family PIN-like protein n=1 Tax=Mucilaginibacter calamicampi TaxID=1302352 RepID=A0ABW2YZ55_9SPHI